MRILPAIGALFLLGASAAQAQIGWTLDECRAHFGEEYQPPHGSTYYFYIGPKSHVPVELGMDHMIEGGNMRYGLLPSGEKVYITFSEGAVYDIEYWKLDGKPFSAEEIRKKLAKSVGILWKPTNYKNSWYGYKGGKKVLEAVTGSDGLLYELEIHRS